MRKRAVALFAIWTLVLGLCSCGTSGTAEGNGSDVPELTYQGYYDLGVRYLSEGNYEEAILAFTAAIEIDPKRAPAYVGRGDIYVLSGETEENLAAAKADYETAIEMDEMLPEAYLGLADVYVRQGSFKNALEILQRGYEKTEDAELSNRIREIEVSQDAFYSSEGFVEYDKLSKEWQDYLTLIVEAFESNDEVAVIEILSERNTGDETDVMLTDSGYMLKTQVSNYKVCWRRVNVGSLVGEYFVKVEIRPQNGTAYSAEYDFEDTVEMTSFSQGDCTSWGQSKIQYFFSGCMKDCFVDGRLLTVIEQSNLDEPVEYSDDYEYGVIANGANSNIRSGTTTLGFDSMEDAKQYLWWD